MNTDITQDVEALLVNALQGDSTAIKLIANRLSGQGAVAQSSQREQIDAGLQAINLNTQFRREAAHAKEKYADIFERPAMQKYMVKRDAHYAKADPSMPFDERLEQAAEDTYSHFGGDGRYVDGREAIASDPRIARGHGYTTFNEETPEPTASDRTDAEQEYVESNSEYVETLRSRTQGRPVEEVVTEDGD